MNDKEMTVTEAARHFADLINRTYYKGESTLPLRSGEPVAKVVPVGGSSILGRDFAAKWRSMRHLDSDDADDFAATCLTLHHQVASLNEKEFARVPGLALAETAPYETGFPRLRTADRRHRPTVAPAWVGWCAGASAPSADLFFWVAHQHWG